MTNPEGPRERGQELVEYGILITIFLMILMVFLDFGRAAYVYSVLQNAARAGARYGIVHPNDSAGVRNAALQIAPGVALNSGDIQVTWNITPSFADPDTVRVTIAHQITAFTPILNLFLGSNQITLNTQTTMQLEQ